YCKIYKTCAHTKTSITKLSGQLHSLPILTQLWDRIGMDFVSPFSKSKGYNYFWVVFC
ncbi:hypothetical protein AN958_10343, partial [Leucoagaricus sp. SymC.cos]